MQGDVLQLRPAGDTDTLAKRVYEQMKRDIVTHRLAPGQRVSEGAVAAHYQTSKAPVRAALGRLQQERLIVQASPKMQVIAPLTLKGVREVFDLRNLLEPEAARLAAGHVDVKLLHRLNEACAQPVSPGDADAEFRLLTANRDFHLEIAAASGNELMADWVARLHDLAGRIMWLALGSPKASLAWGEGHDELIDALGRGDGEQAKAILLRHLREGQHQVYERLLALPGLSGTKLGEPVGRGLG